MPQLPTLDLEQSLFASGVNFVAGVDEVGRGALAGPVTVGVAVIDSTVGLPPADLRDSKQMSAKARESIIDQAQQWTIANAVGSATAAEIDQIGIVAALRLAWTRAYAQLSVKPEHVILDGKHNWLVDNTSSLFPIEIPNIDLPVTMKIKADAHCASVAAASVIAKVHRDQYMAQLAKEFPDFGWESNVGYGAANHQLAIRKLGPTEFHRKSWKLFPEAEQ